MTDTKDIYQRLGEQVGEVVKKAVKQAFIIQGRSLTGALVNSIDYSVNATVNSAFVEFTLLDYGMILNYGVTADRIPYSPGSGAKSSKYIDGLKLYAKLRFNANVSLLLGSTRSSGCLWTVKSERCKTVLTIANKRSKS
jgi:hypothetical protein